MAVIDPDNSYTPPAAQGGEGKGGGDQGQSLLATNDLVYILPPDLSVCVNQTHKNQFFQSQTYTNDQRAVCLLNTGADYGDLRNSSLDFTISITSGPTASYGFFGRYGSILNVIKSITISSRSGDELARIQDFNLLSYHQNPLRYSDEWFKTVGQTIGAGQYLQNNASGLQDYRSQRFSIPLYLLSDFFGYSRLMPAMVLSGLRVEIEWATPAEAFLAFSPTDRDTTPTATTHGIASYTITNPLISIRAVQLTDATQRSLNELSATNGLELVYCDYERTDRVEPSQNINMEIRKAASRALKAQTIIRPQASVTGANNSRLNSLASEPWDVTSWQWQLGSLYYPQQPVATTADSTKIMAASYKHALIAFEKYKASVPGKCAALQLYKRGQSNTSRVTTAPDSEDLTTNGLDGGTSGAAVADSGTPYTAQERVNNSLDYQGLSEGVGFEFDAGTFAYQNGCIATTLERSDLFNLSGVPINNARVLAIRATLQTGGTRVVTSFLKYVKLARVFMNNVEVEQ